MNLRVETLWREALPVKRYIERYKKRCFKLCPLYRAPAFVNVQEDKACACLPQNKLKIGISMNDPLGAFNKTSRGPYITTKVFPMPIQSDWPMKRTTRLKPAKRDEFGS